MQRENHEKTTPYLKNYKEAVLPTPFIISRTISNMTFGSTFITLCFSSSRSTDDRDITLVTLFSEFPNVLPHFL